jgi:putative ATP-dependent endonuclease of the OLD family
MQIKHVKIQNFRGIQELDWSLPNNVICLIGPGDSTKSTIIDAIEYTLSSQWNMSFEDCDFFSGEITKPIEIVVTVSQLPEKLLTEQKFGLCKRGWNSSDGIHDEPRDGDEAVLSIRLRIDESLEPEWAVVSDRDQEGRRISSSDREGLGMIRLGTYIDKHFSWTRGSTLTQLTDRQSSASAVLTTANRKARESANLKDIDEFKSALELAKTAAASLGVKPKAEYTASLDPKAINIGIGAISIHDGNIPLRLTGLGSRRLIALA